MEEIKQKSWFSQNWIWVVPVGGCLTLIVLAVFGLGAAFGVGMLNSGTVMCIIPLTSPCLKLQLYVILKLAMRWPANTIFVH